MFFEGDPDAVNRAMRNHGGYKKQEVLNSDKITRIVVIGENGREYEKWFDKCEISLQDNDCTIKFFTK